MSERVQTWHYGIMARHWAENNTTGPEIDYFQRKIATYGQPALDAGCGTGRLLIPYLRAAWTSMAATYQATCSHTAER